MKEYQDRTIRKLTEETESMDANPRMEYLAKFVCDAWEAFSLDPTPENEGTYEGSYIVYQHELVKQGYIKQLTTWNNENIKKTKER